LLPHQTLIQSVTETKLNVQEIAGKGHKNRMPIYGCKLYNKSEDQYKPLLQLETTPVHLLSWQRSCHVCR